MNFQDRQKMRPDRKPGPTYFALGCLLAVCGLAASRDARAQARPSMSPATPGVHEVDLGVAGTGQYITTSASDMAQPSGAVPPHQSTTGASGALITLRDQPLSFFTVEANYQFTRFSERFTNVPGPSATVSVPTSVHEFTAAYVLSLKRHTIKPFVAIGGGYLLFEPSAQFHHQWRTTGLVDVGFDVPTHTPIGFRFGARALVYRTPDFKDETLYTSRWATGTQPYLGAHYQF